MKTLQALSSLVAAALLFCCAAPELMREVPSDLLDKNFKPRHLQFYAVTQSTKSDAAKEVLRTLESVFEELRAQIREDWADTDAALGEELSARVELFETQRTPGLELRFSLQKQLADDDRPIGYKKNQAGACRQPGLTEEFLEIELVCKANSLVMNFSRELRMLYSEQKKAGADTPVFGSVQTFMGFGYDFTQAANRATLVNWLRKIVSVKEVQVQLPQELRIFRDSHLGVLYVVPELPPPDFADEFFKVAYLRNMNFGVPFMWMSYSQLLLREAPEDKSYASESPLSAVAETESICPPTAFCLILYRNFDDGKKTLVSEVPVDAANLEGFVRTHKRPTVAELSTDSYREYFSKDAEIMLLLCQELKCDEAKDIFTRFAIRNRNQMHFIFGFVETPLGRQLMRQMDIKREEELPAIRIIKNVQREVFKFKSAADENIFRSFVENKLMPKRAQSAPPSEADRGEQMARKLRGIRKRGGYGRR